MIGGRPGLRASVAAGLVVTHLALRLAGAGSGAGMLSGTSAPSAASVAFVLGWFGLVILAPALLLSLLLEASARRAARALSARG